MTADQNNWNSRLAVKFNGTDVVQPIIDFNPQFTNAIDVIDSIDGCNLGYSYGNPKFKFDFTIMALNKAVFRKIFSTAVAGTRFTIGMAYKTDKESQDWIFSSMDFIDCVVIDITPSTIKNDGKAPTMKVSAICLNFSITGANSDTVTSSEDGTTLGTMS